MDVRGGLLALGVGLIVSLAVVWGFFATLLPLAGTSIGHPWRGSVPFLAVLLVGLALARLTEGSPRRLGLLVAAPGAILGSALGVWAALRPIHLLVVLLLAFIYLGAGVLGAELGSLS